MTEKNYFKELAAVDVRHLTEKKNDKFTYLSWAFAQEVLGEHHPEAIIEVREYGENNLPYLETPLGYFVQVYVTINEVKRGRPFTVTDSANRPLGAEYWVKDKSKPEGGYYTMNRKPNAFDINTAIQRAFVKSVAEHGLGLYVYAGEDLPKAVANNRKDELLTKFAELRQNPKTDNWFIAKESLLGRMEEWEMSVMESMNTELDRLKKQADAKAAEKAKAEAELARREGSKPAEEKKPLKDQGMDLEKQKFILDACKQYPLVDETVGEFMTKLKKETLTQLTGKQFENLYGIVEIKIRTAEKELAANASS